MNSDRITFDDVVHVGEMNGLLARMDADEGGRYTPREIFHYSLRDEVKEGAALEHGINVTARLADGELVGYMRVVSDRSYIHYIVDVMVDPDHQGERLGSRLVNAALVELKKGGFIKILLTAIPGKEEFYKRMGFQETMSPVLALRGEDYREDIG